MAKIGQHWPGTGYTFCGILPSKTVEEPDYALLLVDVFFWPRTWEAAMAPASLCAEGLAMANLTELALMRTTVPHCFRPGWYWSSEQDPEHATLASGQDMATGQQSIEHVSHLGYAVLVQRVALLPAPATPLA